MKILTFTAIALTALTTGILASPVQAIPSTPTTLKQSVVYSNADLGRAKNLARQAAERENGGLSQYSAEAAMHGPISEAPYRVNRDGTVTFDFLGGRPGFTVPTLQSIVTVNLSNWEVVIEYNGPIQAER